MSIKVHEVVKIYDSQRALDNVSFEVTPGEIVGFLGPNGAGKSTMMRIICGYIPQTSGKLEVCGLDVGDEDIKVKQRLGYLPENNPLYLEMYVQEYLKFTGSIFGIANLEDRVTEIIELVGLTREQHKKIGALSKGYRQRVGLAQAFIHDPEVLILDEPTTGLDPNQIIEIRELIKRIGKDKTVLLSTHIMQEVEAICDRAIIINDGKIVADKSIDSLKKASAGNDRLFVEFTEPINRSALEKSIDPKDLKYLDDLKIEIQAPDLVSLKKLIMKISLEQEWEISNMSESSSNLEDIFRSLTASKSE